jgi:hypothetical protein
MKEKDPVSEMLYIYQEGARIAELMLQWAMIWTTSVRFPAEARDFSLPCRVETIPWAYPASFPMGTGCSFSGCKAAMT